MGRTRISWWRLQSNRRSTHQHLLENFTSYFVVSTLHYFLFTQMLFNNHPLKWIVEKLNGVWTALIWLRIGISGGLFGILMKIRVTQNAGNFLSGWANFGFWKRTQLHGSLEDSWNVVHKVLSIITDDSAVTSRIVVDCDVVVLNSCRFHMKS
jgi:hypothetical protein